MIAGYSYSNRRPIKGEALSSLTSGGFLSVKMAEAIALGYLPHQHRLASSSFRADVACGSGENLSRLQFLAEPAASIKQVVNGYKIKFARLYIAPSIWR